MHTQHFFCYDSIEAFPWGKYSGYSKACLLVYHDDYSCEFYQSLVCVSECIACLTACLGETWILVLSCSAFCRGTSLKKNRLMCINKEGYAAPVNPVQLLLPISSRGTSTSDGMQFPLLIPAFLTTFAAPSYK